MTLETPRTALLNLAPVPVNMAVCAMQHRPLRSMGFPWNPCWCGQNRQEVCQPQNMASSAETAKVTPVGPQKGRKIKKIFFEKVHNFSVLDKGDCQTTWLCAHWGPFGRETRFWPDGADPPHFDMHIGEIGQFFEVWVFLQPKLDYV